MLKILKAYGIPESSEIIVDAIQDSYSETRAKVTTPDGETDEFEIFAGVLQGDTLAIFSSSLSTIAWDQQLMGERKILVSQ